MTLRRFLPVALILLMANAVHAQLAAPAPDRATDYQNWFGSLAPSGGLLVSSLQDPAAYNFSSAAGTWIHWFPPGELGSVLDPILTSSHPLTCEIIFLGCTGSGWSRFGYTLSGTDHLLSANPTALSFGDFLEFQSPSFTTLNVFVERGDGTRCNAFSESPGSTSSPGASVSIYVPRESTRPYDFYPYTIFAFSPDLSVADPEVFVFAVSAGFDDLPAPVPEPATYGAIGAGALLGLAALRRHRRRA